MSAPPNNEVAATLRQSLGNEFADRAGSFRIGNRCQSCPPGSRTERASNEPLCLQCPLVTFAAKPGSTECEQCPTGTVALKFGSTMCTRCPKGQIPGPTGSFFTDSACVIPATNCAPKAARNPGRRTPGTFIDSPDGCKTTSCPANSSSFKASKAGECFSREPGSIL